MTRGARQEVGATRLAPNGYHYTKVDSGWRLTHHIKMEEHIGRPLAENERVHFKTSNKQDFSQENLVLVVQGTTSARRKVAQLKAKIQDLQKELEYWESQLS